MNQTDRKRGKEKATILKKFLPKKCMNFLGNNHGFQMFYCLNISFGRYIAWYPIPISSILEYSYSGLPYGVVEATNSSWLAYIEPILLTDI